MKRPWVGWLVFVLAAAGCGPRKKNSQSSDGGAIADLSVLCLPTCSDDRRQVVDCNSAPLQSCADTAFCDLTLRACVDACADSATKRSSIGCEYYATLMPQYKNACFAAFVANTWSKPAHLQVSYQGKSLPVATFARIPSGFGPGLTYKAYNDQLGIPAGEVVILFLAGSQKGDVPCPVEAALPLLESTSNTQVASSFRIESDVPVVAYQMNPYGGGAAAVTGASLLLPTSVWDTNYVATNAYDFDPSLAESIPSIEIIAAQDDTQVIMVPVTALAAGQGIPGADAGKQMVFTLQRGQRAQLSEKKSLTGSIIESTKPIGFLTGNKCFHVPLNVSYCDHGEQMLPPIKALGSEYVGVMYRPRKGEPAIWRVVGVVKDTQLSWSKNVGGPATLGLGQVGEFVTGEPFVVKSQDEDHPFMLFSYMSGSTWKAGLSDYGDPDFVISVPPQQYMKNYVLFADPTYPETNLVLVRAREGEQFFDVNLDCLGPVGGWKAVGDYEWTRVDLSTGNFQPVGKCQTGRHELTSSGKFGLWVWGWGTPNTSPNTQNVSYGYPAGMNVQLINKVEIPPS